MRNVAISFSILALGLAARPSRAFAQDYGKLNACVMKDDGGDATGYVNNMSNAMWPYHHADLNVYASVRAIASANDSAGCDAIVSIKYMPGFASGSDSANILSGLSKRTLYQGPAEGWNANSDDLEHNMATLLQPGGETYNAIVAEKVADCPNGPSQATPFCQAVAQKAQQEKDAKAAAERAAVQAANAQAARQAASMEESIREQIPAWRALKKKPAMPDEAHKFKVLAEDAVHEKRFDDAVKYYEQALAIFPLWPEGQFNAAMLNGELRRFAGAASHMRLYVELAPNAKDLQVAKDKIIVWDEKAKNGVQ